MGYYRFSRTQFIGNYPRSNSLRWFTNTIRTTIALLSFLLSIIAFLPFENPSQNLLSYQWQLAASAIYFNG